jgi:hypothetical protein
MSETIYYVYYKSTPDDGHLCNVSPCTGHIIYERNTGTEQAAKWRVEELQKRGRDAWYQTTMIRGAMY